MELSNEVQFEAPPENAGKKQAGKRRTASKANKIASPVAENLSVEDQMFENSDIEYSDAEESDSDNEQYYEQDDTKARKQNPASQEQNKDGLEEAEDGHFVAWQRSRAPVIPDRQFTGISGPQHTLDPASAVPFQYFCLFIPLYFYDKIATYTNAKAGIESVKKEGKVRDWKPTCGAEIKAWFASVMWWCLSKGLSFEQFVKVTIDANRARKWFPSLTRWQQIKRFLKVSDPYKDPNHVHDRMYRVRELFDFFISACKANYWPEMNVALDEAIKKFKGRCMV